MPVLTPVRTFSLRRIVLLDPSAMLDGLELTFQGIRAVLPCGRADCRNITPSFWVTPIVAR